MIGRVPGSGNATGRPWPGCSGVARILGVARTFDHPRLGRLTRTGFGWHGRRDDLHLAVGSGWRRPDEDQAALLVATLSDLERLDERARAFAADEWETDSMELVGVEAAKASTGWTRELGREECPLFATLQYAFPGDRNVLDVFFLEGEPAGHDYH